MTRSVPAFLYGFLNGAEARRLVAYQDSAGVWTIGVGHTGHDIIRGLRITAAQSDEYLHQDVAHAVNALYAVCHPDRIEELTEHQYAAILSFVFNLGANASWNIWKLINTGQFDAVPAEMMRFTRAHVGGRVQVLRGLQARRTAEVTMWHQADTPTHAAAIALAGFDASAGSATTRPAATPPTPAPTAQPLMTSRTMWAGAGTAAAGAAAGLTQVQNLVSTQSANSTQLAQISGFIGIGIVVLGVAVMAFRWLDEREKHH
jgi:lysozyme